MSIKNQYADKCFGLPVEQVKYFEELTEDQQAAARTRFGRLGVERYVYAVKRDGSLVANRERFRPEWGETRY